MAFPKWTKGFASLLSVADRLLGKSGAVALTVAAASSLGLLTGADVKATTLETAPTAVTANVTRYAKKFVLAPSGSKGSALTLAQHRSHSSHSSHSSHRSHRSGGH